MKKKSKSLILSLAIFGMLLSGCNGTAPTLKEEDKQSDYISNEEMTSLLNSWNPQVSYQRDTELNPVFDEMTPIPESEQTRLSSSIFDFHIGDSLKIRLIDDVGETNGSFLSQYKAIVDQPFSYDEYISVSDINGQGQDIILTTDGSCLSLPVNSSFDYGAVYIVELIKEDTFYFDGKDQSIQRLTLEIEDDPDEAETYDIDDKKENIPVLDLSKVSEENVDETSIFSFVYDGTVPSLTKNQIFLVKNNQNNSDMEITDFYGKYLYQEDLGNGKYKVYYVEPQGNEIYNNLRKKGAQAFDLEGRIRPLDDEDELLSALRNSSFVRGFVNFYTKMSGKKDVVLLEDLLDNLKLDIKFNYYNEKLTFSLSLHLDQIKLTENLFLSFAFKYTQAVSFSVDFDISIKTKWFIPVGISYKLKMGQVKQESFEFSIALDYVKSADPSADPDEEQVKNTLYDELQKEKAPDPENPGLYSRLMGDAQAVAQTEGNKTTIPLFEIDCPIYPPVVFDFRVDFIIDLSIQAMLVGKKQWESETTLFNFSNQKGGDGDTGQSIKGSNFWDVYLMGKIELTLSLRFSGNLYIEGRYKFCHVSLYFELYIKIGVQGVLTASFPSDSDPDLLGNISIDFYVLMGAKVGLEIVLAFLKKDFSIDVFKTYILRLVFSNSLEAFADDAQEYLDLTQTIYSLNESNVLKFIVWNGVTMRMETKKLSADSSTKIIESWFGDVTKDMFTFEPSDSSLMEISEDGVIHVKDGTDAEFTTTFWIRISNFAGFLSDREITVHFVDLGAKHVYIDDVDMGRYRHGVEFTLPEAPSKDGYKFLNYKLGTQILNPGDKITVLDEDIHITIDWHKIIYYTVMFYDGFNHLIHVDSHVEEETAVTPPSPEIRDQFMSGYFFIGWDKKIDYITSDLIVHGVYMKVGD